MLPWAIVSYFLYSLVLGCIACSYILVADHLYLLIFLVPLFVFINLFAGTKLLSSSKLRLKICQHGAVLLIVFELSMIISILYHIVLAFFTIPDNYQTLLYSMLTCTVVEGMVFWNGVICVYCTSLQLGVGQRIIGVICGLIPGVNVLAMNVIIWTVLAEVRYEGKKEAVNQARKEQQICKTRYPVLMVHGVFFRDTKYFNYWGRIPKELEINGAEVYYGNHQSAAAIATSAEELTKRIKEIVETTGCEKVNIIAHSKGGLDCRYAIDKLGMGPYVASFTTVNTPHRGCIFADKLMYVVPERYQHKIAHHYNAAMKRIGDHNPDFLAAVSDLTASACEKFNQEITYVPEEIYCQSVGTLLKKARGGRFPMNLSYYLVKLYDGENDGLVSETSFPWGERYTLLTPKRKQGISHCDITDLNRRNLKDFDIREFYVQMVSDLRQRGF